MTAVILGCDTNALLRWGYPAAVGHVALHGGILKRWPLYSCPDVEEGTEAWLLVHGSNDAGSGLIGHGLVMSQPCRVDPGGDHEAAGWFVAVAFDALLPLGEQIRAGTVGNVIPKDLWAQAAGPALVTLPPSYVPVLRRLWRELGPTTADPAEVVGGSLPPAAVSNIQVNRYERDPDARRACLAFHGTRCAACGFSFESTYGETGTGALAVHHVVPPAMLEGGYELDPIADLVPLCRNCHAVAHGATPPLSVTELQSMISGAGHLRGDVAAAPVLQAQEDARRILEAGQA